MPTLDVKTLCLAVLTSGDKTGYEIKKHFEDAFSHFFVAGYGSIYPALSELTRTGHVTCTDVAQTGRPDKKVYRITPAGRAGLATALEATPPRHKVRSEFMVLLYFADLLPPARLAAIVDERLRDIDTLLEHIAAFERRPLPSNSQRMVAGLGRVSLEAQRGYLVQHRDALLRAPRARQAGERNAEERNS